LRRGPWYPLICFHILPVIHAHPIELKTTPRSAVRNMNRIMNIQLTLSDAGFVVVWVTEVTTDEK
jgi:hypothetical protein